MCVSNPKRFFNLFCLPITITIILLTLHSCNSEFIATKDWQKVPEGESIPAGLHVKLDLENGGRWAKLLDDEDKNREINPENVQKAEVIVHEDENINFDPEMQKKRERVAHLRKIWDELQEQVITDFKQMEKLVVELDLYAYKAQQATFSDEDADKFEEVSDDFGILLSQVDNAVDAAKHGILGQILGIYEKYPHRNILRLFSSSAQNNPPVAKALKNALKPILEKTIINTSKDNPILKSAVFCLSAITRSLVNKVGDDSVLDEGALLEFDWKGMLEAQNN